MNLKNKFVLVIFSLGLVFSFYKFTGVPESKYQLENCLKSTNKINIVFFSGKENKNIDYTEKEIPKGQHLARLINTIDSDEGKYYFEVTCENVKRKVNFSKDTFNENITIQNVFQLMK